MPDDHLKLCRVILPYHASEPGELSLEIDELVDIIKEYKSTGWGFGRRTGTKEKGKFPLNFVAILGEKSSEFSDDAFTEKGLLHSLMFFSSVLEILVFIKTDEMCKELNMLA